MAAIVPVARRCVRLNFERHRRARRCRNLRRQSWQPLWIELIWSSYETDIRDRKGNR